MKNPNADLKRNYKTALELSLIAALLLCHLAFFAMRNFQLQAFAETTKRPIIEALPPPATAQPKPPAPPPRPTPVAPSNDDELPEEITIPSTTEFSFSDFRPPPPPPEEEKSDFISYDKAPELIGGLASISRNVRYPEMARQIQREGTVIVKVLVNKKGLPEQVKLLRSAGFDLLDEAALAAVRRLRWRPAMQRDKPVKVWVAFPVRFYLR